MIKYFLHIQPFRQHNHSFSFDLSYFLFLYLSIYSTTTKNRANLPPVKISATNCNNCFSMHNFLCAIFHTFHQLQTWKSAVEFKWRTRHISATWNFTLCYDRIKMSLFCEKNVTFLIWWKFYSQLYWFIHYPMIWLIQTLASNFMTLFNWIIYYYFWYHITQHLHQLRLWKPFPLIHIEPPRRKFPPPKPQFSTASARGEFPLVSISV